MERGGGVSIRLSPPNVSRLRLVGVDDLTLDDETVVLVLVPEQDPRALSATTVGRQIVTRNPGGNVHLLEIPDTYEMGSLATEGHTTLSEVLETVLRPLVCREPETQGSHAGWVFQSEFTTRPRKPEWCMSRTPHERRKSNGFTKFFRVIRDIFP